MSRACRFCGFPRAGPARSVQHNELCPGQSAETDLPCPECSRGEFRFDSVVALWAYQDRVCDVVVAAKYAHQAPLADAVGRRLSVRVAEHFKDEWRPQVVTTVPSHLSRLISRGGSGLEPVAEAIARRMNIPFRPLLAATRRIAKQAWLDDSERIKNVRGAFTCKKGYAFRKAPIRNYQHILLVDDVLTTGATANEATRVLREGGAHRVSLAVVARAIRQH